MHSSFRLQHLAAVPALIVAVACSSTPSKEPTSAPAAPAQSETQPIPVSGTKDPILEISTASATLAPVYFDTDAAALRPEATGTLGGYAKSILDHPEWGVLSIEGHCDERGSDAYNLTLGQHRAAAVERRLIEMGVPQTRLVTRTFGAQKPAVPGHDEKAWRHNRRSELRVGGAHLSSL
jgi:peptidoglycan-associated lipoprotein